MMFLLRLLYSAIYIGGIGILANVIGERVPRRWFSANSSWFRPRSWEKDGKIYEKVAVQKWKDRAPDMSKINPKMVRKKVGVAPTSQSVQRLITETCVAEATHAVLCLLAIGIFFFWQSPIGILFVILDIFGNLPFIVIQRYNRPRLMNLAQRLALREERKKHACVDSICEYGGRT